jgi:hypothetical protein
VALTLPSALRALVLHLGLVALQAASAAAPPRTAALGIATAPSAPALLSPSTVPAGPTLLRASIPVRAARMVLAVLLSAGAVLEMTIVALRTAITPLVSAMGFRFLKMVLVVQTLQSWLRVRVQD